MEKQEIIIMIPEWMIREINRLLKANRKKM